MRWMRRLPPFCFPSKSKSTPGATAPVVTSTAASLERSTPPILLNCPPTNNRSPATDMSMTRSPSSTSTENRGASAPVFTLSFATRLCA